MGAGHAHAGVLLVLSLPYFLYLARTVRGPAVRAAPVEIRGSAWALWGPPAALAGAVVVVAALMLGWSGEGPGRVDTWTEAFFARHRSDVAHRTSGVFTRLGGREIVVPIGFALAAVVAYRRRSVRPLVMMAAVYLLAAGPAAFLKEFLHRAEPGDVAGELGRSFPSGHTTQAAAVYGMAALLWAEGASSRRRRVAAGLAVAASIVVGVAMLVRGAHWLSDVVAGYVIALPALVTVAAVSVLVRSRDRDEGIRPRSRPVPRPGPHPEP